jgi:RNA polymerase sigma-70 factor (ECF subfamily)
VRHVDVLSPDELSALVRRAQGGDAAAFAALARAFARSLYAVALAHLGRPAEAEDAAQDALLVGLERIDDCRQPERFGGWLLRIARSRALNALEKRRLRDVPAEADPVEAAAGPTQELAVQRGELLAALGELSEVQREVVLLHDLDGWTHAEIAAALELSEETSRQHLSRARRALRARPTAKEA